ncbi:unnamed protein product [Fusarium venenatum]|uniref:Uncharacterized protein n=1 Tax=Fusarium venenatum TaxID=56646 RepID=A0A2L2T8N4_9HYPO|nr:uncharacterized protein FVRRES_02850 [Fusarium venenatum]CEI66338.1 unnamed protein product [Fusarium venenatum]
MTTNSGRQPRIRSVAVKFPSFGKGFPLLKDLDLLYYREYASHCDTPAYQCLVMTPDYASLAAQGGASIAVKDMVASKV